MISYQQKLRNMAARSEAPGREHSRVLRLLAETLGVAPQSVSPDAPFAELGLNSLLGVRFLDAVNRAFDLRLGVEALFAHRTAAALARHIETLAPRPAIVAAPEPAPLRDDDIAVIGMAGRFPGAPDVAAFWSLLAEGRSAVGAAPADRRPAFGDEIRAGFLEGVAQFDAAFFGISPREAAAMDPCHRLFLEEAWRAFENAGLSAERLAGGAVGVFVGASGSGYEALLDADSKSAQSYGLTGNLASMIAARVAYALDLKGPSLVVDTACSSSLVAVALACDALRRGEIDLALAGGVALFLDPLAFDAMRRAGMLSPSGACRAFDAASDGIAVGEAAAAVVLKPLRRALADGDRIDAVIKATGTNQDGRSNGVTAPNPQAQTDLMRAVHRRAGVAPETITFVEAHGTGTPLGDPIEVAALREALGPRDPEAAPCWLGSAKASVGHTAEAAGIVGLIKTILCLRHGELPASAHFSALNPKIDVGRSGLSVLTARRPWLAASGAPRRGAVSAFGLSGTNAHAVLEEAPALDRARPTPAPTLLLLSARDAEALARKVADLAAWLRGPGADAALVDVGATLARGRTHFAHRLALIAATPAEAAERLAAGDYRIAIADGAGAAPASNRGDLDAFAAQYLSGAAPEWPTLWPEGRRALDLPGYPFAPTEHWAVRPPSTTESGLRVRLRPDDPLVRDHIVDGAAILHAAVFLDLACRAGEAIFGAAPRGLRDIAWERTIAVPESGIELRIDTAPAGVDVAANLRPQGGEVAARCRLTRAAAPAPSRLDIAASKARADLHMDRGALVGLDRGAARLGPSFAGLDALWLGEDVALGRIDNLEIEPGRLLPLRLSDAIIQTAAALLARADGPAPALRYPVAVAAIDLHAPLPRQASILARRAGPDQIDVTVADDQGAPCLHWSGLTLRRAGAPAPVARAFRPFFAEAPAALLPRRRLDAAIGGPAFAAAFADLSPLAADPAEPREIAELVRRLPSGALILYGAAERPAPEHLLALLKALAADGPAQIELRIAVAPMRRVDGRERAVDPAGAVLEGLAKAAGREHPGWTMIILDVDALEPSRELLLATPAEASGEPVALRGGRRYARRLSPVESLGAQASGLREGGAYLITGGMGRIGREIARHLAEHWRGKLVLVGRRPLDAERGAFLESLRRLGAEADYHALDIAEPSALDPVIAAMKARFGAVHGVIQAAVDPLFARIAETGAADFAAALRPKVAGLREIARATRNETLDFLAVFSSIGAYAAFPGNVGQASYCAACCFEEAFAAELSAAGRPVRLIQWGLWRHDAFAGDGVARLARQGVEAMAPAEAVRAFERIVGGAENRIVHAALGDAVWQAMGAPAAPGAAFAAAAEAARAASSGAVGSIASIEAVDAYGRHAARRRLQERGVLAAGEPAPAAEDLGRRLGALPRHARLVAALAELLARCGETAPDRAALLALEPRLRDSLDLLDHCVAALPDVVAGERQGPDVLFPEGSMRLVEAIHRDQPVLAACNVVMARAAQASGSLRIVEIGAGAGATTRAVLDALGDAPFDYSFTDVSAAFVKRARGLFADPRLRFGVLDIERDPGSQGFAAGGFDLVLATNVLHATRDIAESLRHASSLLKPQGLLLLDEMTRAEDFATLTFGLLDGWWRAEDAAIRLPHSPLLDVAGWRRALEAAGLAHVVAAPAPGFNASASPQTVLLAEKPAAPSPARAAPARASEGSAEDFIRAMVAAGLDMAAEAIDPERPFGEIGVDSIVAPQITEDINRAAGIELRATDLYNFPNVRRLAAHIAERFPQVSFCHPGEEVNQLRSSATPSPIGRRWPGEAGSDEGNAGANIGEKEPPHPAAPRPPSPFGLRDSRKRFGCCDGVSGEHGGEAVPSVSHRLGAGRLVVAVPASQTGCDPSEPCERALLMRVLLPFRLALQGLADRLERLDQGLVDDVATGARAAVARVDQLNDASRRSEGHRREPHQPLGVDDLAVLEREPVAFEGAEQLLDPPAQAIATHDLARLFGGFGRMGGQEPPQQRSDAFRRLDLARLHQRQLDSRRARLFLRGEGGRGEEADADRAQLDPGEAPFVARPARRDLGHCRRQRRGRGGRLEERAAFDTAILGGAHDEMDALGTPREKLEDVALAVADDGDFGGRAELLCGARAAFEPARRFLVLESAAAPRRRLRLRTRPDPRVDEADYGLVIGVYGQHRMDEEARIASIAGGPQAATLGRAAGEIDLARILCGHHPATGAALRGARAQRLHDRLDRGEAGRQEAMGAHLAAARGPDLTQGQRPRRRDLLHQPVAAALDTNVADPKPHDPPPIRFARTCEAQMQRFGNRFRELRSPLGEGRASACKRLATAPSPSSAWPGVSPTRAISTPSGTISPLRAAPCARSTVSTSRPFSTRRVAGPERPTPNGRRRCRIMTVSIRCSSPSRPPRRKRWTRSSACCSRRPGTRSRTPA